MEEAHGRLYDRIIEEHPWLPRFVLSRAMSRLLDILAPVKSPSRLQSPAGLGGSTLQGDDILPIPRGAPVVSSAQGSLSSIQFGRFPVQESLPNGASKDRDTCQTVVGGHQQLSEFVQQVQAGMMNPLDASVKRDSNVQGKLYPGGTKDKGVRTPVVAEKGNTILANNGLHDVEKGHAAAMMLRGPAAPLVGKHTAGDGIHVGYGVGVHVGNGVGNDGGGVAGGVPGKGGPQQRRRGDDNGMAAGGVSRRRDGQGGPHKDNTCVVPNEGASHKAPSKVATPGTSVTVNISSSIDSAGLALFCDRSLNGRISYGKLEKSWSLSLLSAKLTKAWRLKGPLTLVSLGLGFVNLQFGSLEERDRIARFRSFSLQPGHLRLFRWSPDFDPLKSKSLASQVWVRLFNLPPEYRFQSVLFDIIRSIGTPVRVDERSLGGRYVRILVELASPKVKPNNIMAYFRGRQRCISLTYEARSWGRQRRRLLGDGGAVLTSDDGGEVGGDVACVPGGEEGED